PVGTYRESGNGLGPGTDPLARAQQKNFSGFSYKIEVSDPGKPYLVEIDYPDDAWRTMCVPLLDVYKYGEEYSDGYAPRGYAFETGGYYPLSNQMQTESFFVWPNGKEFMFGLVSSRIGKRAAAAEIRIYEIEDKLPSQTRGAEGRFMGLFMEEPERWHNHFNTPPKLPTPVRDYIGLTRVMEWASYIGINGFWPSITAYQNCTYPSKELVGYLVSHYNTPRLSALLCEKYGMAFAGEIFLARQKYFNDYTMLEGVEKPEELYTTTWWGYHYDPDTQGGILPTWNILHPHVQDKVIGIYGEIADTLGDTESFVGLSGRLMSWRWDGLYGLSSLNWGYSDWTIAQFEKDTGITVPGKAGDQDRFEARYRFLTAPNMKAQWMAWRQGRVSGFLKRLGARIRQAKPEAVFFLTGSAESDQVHKPSLPEQLEERYLGMGIDPAVFDEDSGVSLMPIGYFGRGKTGTYIEDQNAYDVFTDVDYSTAGGGAINSFTHSGSYQEWGNEFPYEKLGMMLRRPPHYCTGSDAAGINLLGRLSMVLAEQDTMAIQQGAYPLLHGRRDFFSSWMAAYSSLPRHAFTKVEFARDPVAVWERSESNAYWFYMVNREQYPVTIELTLKGVSQLEQLATETTVDVSKGKLVMTLAPYELQSFRTKRGGEIRGAKIDVPQERVDYLKALLVHAQQVSAEIGERNDAVATTYRDRLALADSALNKGAYWRARTLLSSGPMMQVYADNGGFPEGLLHVQFPNMLEQTLAGRYDPNIPYADATQLWDVLENKQDAKIVDSSTFNPDWSYTEVIRKESGTMTFDLDVPGNGYYQLSFGYVASASGLLKVTLDGKSLGHSLEVTSPGSPEKAVFPLMLLPEGNVQFTIESPVPFGVYGTMMAPELRAIPTTDWSTVGPFKSYWDTSVRQKEARDPQIKKGADEVYPPQVNPDIHATYTDMDGKNVTWTQTDEVIALNEENGVNFAPREGIISNKIAFAQTYIWSPEAQDVLLYIGTDWWANAYLNGELLKPEAGKKSYEEEGYWYTGWKPRTVRAHLNKGVNQLLIKNQGGTMHCWFTARITETGNLKIAPSPESL
ncbi:MAG: hypothetical protein ACQKBW_02755, partial [Puniceicoccales bacterium]